MNEAGEKFNQLSVSAPNGEGEESTLAADIQMAAPAVLSLPEETLADIAAEVRKSGKPRAMTVRTLLGWFGYQRRGAFVVFMIDQALAEFGLGTQPDYRSAWLDSEIALVPAPVSPQPTTSTPTGEETAVVASFDPTYRLGRLRAANNPPVSVSPQHTVKEALTIMMLNDFSQLPVMSGERTLRGVISLSSLAKRLALEAKCDTVQDCVEPARIVRSDTFLFDSINDIINDQYVLVQGGEGKITGIVTTSDLSLEFRQLAEPFLLLGEIEQHVRVLIERGKFTADELNDSRDEKDTTRVVSKASDLTFGEYARLLENPDRWKRLQVHLDRAEFLKPLRRIGTIRNDVMHFDPDPLAETDLMLLRNFVALLQSLRKFLYL
jgi:CBS domain-containing protein